MCALAHLLFLVCAPHHKVLGEACIVPHKFKRTFLKLVSQAQVAVPALFLSLLLYLFCFTSTSCHFNYHSATRFLLDLCCFHLQFFCLVKTLYLHVNYSETRRNWCYLAWQRCILVSIYLKWFWKVFMSQAVVDLSHPCRAACCLHAAATVLHEEKKKKLELGGFHRMAKNNGGALVFGRKLCKRSLEWIGWGDNETDGRFYTQPKSENRSQAKAETIAEARRKEESMGLFQIIKKSKN